MTTETFRRQVAVMLRIVPMVAEEECFALKGGTAINFFFRNMPRLSVDIDLVYLPVKSRQDSPGGQDYPLPCCRILRMAFRQSSPVRSREKRQPWERGQS